VPGATWEHQETWRLVRDVPAPQSDDDIEQHVLPHVAR
jgi:hypothetical protein